MFEVIQLNEQTVSLRGTFSENWNAIDHAIESLCLHRIQWIYRSKHNFPCFLCSFGWTMQLIIPTDAFLFTSLFMNCVIFIADVAAVVIIVAFSRWFSFAIHLLDICVHNTFTQTMRWSSQCTRVYFFSCFVCSNYLLWIGGLLAIICCFLLFEARRHRHAFVDGFGYCCCCCCQFSSFARTRNNFHPYLYSHSQFFHDFTWTKKNDQQQ